MPEVQHVLVDNMPTRMTVFNENEMMPFILEAWNRGDRPTVILAEDDGTLRTWAVQVYQDANGNERVALVEVDGTVRQQMVLWETTTPGPIRWRGEPALGEATVSLYGTDTGGGITGIENETTGELRTVGMGWTGAAVDRIAIEATGEQKISLYGQDEAANVDPLRTDPNRIPWSRPYDGYVQVDPVEIPAAEGILWNPGAAAAELYEVRFEVVNNDPAGAPRAVSVGVDLAAGGALAAPEYWLFNYPVPYPGSSGMRGPYIIAGDDDIRGIAAVVNTLSIHWRIRRVDVGA